MNDSCEQSITLTVTAACNLQCSYCYENNKEHSSMSFKTAKEILDTELKSCSSEIYIELFGGEPFLEFNLIKQIYDYLMTNWAEKKWIMFATTNGTLIHNEIQSWLSQHRRFVCGLSLDGNKYMQDINRSNSFDMIDLGFFIKTYPNQAVKMTISQETLPYVYDGVTFLHNKGFKVNCNLAFGIDWNNETNANTLERELKKLINYYLTNPKIQPCSMLNFPIEHLGLDRNKQTIRKWCGTGTHMKAYYIDGTAYPCQFFMPISAGKTKAKTIDEIEFTEKISINKIDDKCKDCKILEACPTCYGSNYVSTGSIYSKDMNLCKLTKIIIKARSYFRALQWEKGLLQLDSKKEQALLRSILLIQENL